MPLTPKTKRFALALAIAGVICALGLVTFLANIHGGSAFSRGILSVAFPTVSLAEKLNLMDSPVQGYAVLLSAFLLWVALAYFVLYLVRDDNDNSV